MPATSRAIEHAFALIEAAAISGARCPQSRPYGPLDPQAVTMLYRAGRIRGEVFTDNFRRITILAGPNAGKATRDPPKGGKPHRVIDAGGVAPERPPGMGQPSAPRLLTSAEIRKLAP